MRRACALFLIAAVLAGAAAAAPAVKVRTAADLVKAIAPGAVIELAPGTYDLGSASKLSSKYLSWDSSSGDPEPVIHDLDGLTITGREAELAVSSPYTRVLTFRGCSGITLRGLSLGHRVSEPCMAGVLGFEDCEDSALESCELYGSGAVGLELEGSEGIAMRSGAVRSCTVGAFWIEDCRDLEFSGVRVSGNAGGYPLVRVGSSSGVTFLDCDFSDNEGETFLSSDGEAEDFGFESCSFEDNEFKALAEGEVGAYFYEVSYEGNSFDALLDGLVEYGGEDEGGLARREIEGSGLALDYPGWFEVDASDPARLLLHEGDPKSAGILVFKVSALKTSDDPDTQAERIFRAAAPVAERRLAQAGISSPKRTREEPVNTEAPPYHFEYYSSASLGGKPVYLRIKLIHGANAVWCVAAYNRDAGLLEPGADYGMVLDSLRPAGGD